MFKEVRELLPSHFDKITTAYQNSERLGIDCQKFSFRELKQKDLVVINNVVDMVFSMTGESQGMCFIIHPMIKAFLKQQGYNSELIIGSLKIDGRNFIKCDIEYISDQWESGYQEGDLNVHCWLLLENGMYLDVTAYGDAFEIYGGLDILGPDTNIINGHSFEYDPIIVGDEFILKTSVNPSMFT